MKHVLLLLTCCFMFAAVLNAQDVIYLNNGNVVKGKVVKNTDEVSVVVKSGETLTYRKAEVREVQIGSTEVKTPSEPKRREYVDLSNQDNGWWCAVEAQVGGLWYWKQQKMGVFDLAFTNGYRFSEFFKLGIGIAARYQLNKSEMYAGYLEKQKVAAPMSIPLFINMRGNILSQKVRLCAPFWNVDVGYAILDNFFFDAGLGFRAAGKRNNFVVSFNYMGQLISYDPAQTRFANGILFKIGYEF